MRGPVLWQWLGVSSAADGERSALKVRGVKVSVYVCMCVRERKVGEVHVARESKEASAARDIDAALSPRTPPAPCDLARGKTRPAWARDTTIHSVCVCVRVLM